MTKIFVQEQKREKKLTRMVVQTFKKIEIKMEYQMIKINVQILLYQEKKLMKMVVQ